MLWYQHPCLLAETWLTSAPVMKAAWLWLTCWAGRWVQGSSSCDPVCLFMTFPSCAAISQSVTTVISHYSKEVRIVHG